MRKLLKSLYRLIPGVRELVEIRNEIQSTRQAVQSIEWRSRLVETTSLMQCISSLECSDTRYSDPIRLLKYGAQYCSQNLEDGMIAEIFRRIGTTSRTFLEIGVGDGGENNTAALLTQGWAGWWVDGDETCIMAIKARLLPMKVLASRLCVVHSFVSPENICSLLAKYGVPSEVDLFSLDIDLNTFHIWSALETFKPRVVVVEYNAAIPPNTHWVHPFDPDANWDYTQAFGASLKAYENLGRKFGYALVGCDLTGVNAFFVRSDLVGDKFKSPFSAENHFEPARYGLSFRWGHRARFFGESHPV